MKKLKGIDLGKDKVSTVIIKLALPAIIAQLIIFLYNLVDRIFVGRIEGIGTEALAALGICLPITLCISAFINLVGIGGSSRASYKLGENNKEEANKIFNNSLILLILFSIILTLITFFLAEDILILFGCPKSSLKYAIDYLKIYSLGSTFIIIGTGLNYYINTLGYSFHAMFSILLGALLNIILDPIFIYLLNLGVKGAAIATIISQAISMIYVLLFFILKKEDLHFKIKDMVLNFKTISLIITLGLTPFVMTFTEALIQIVFNINLKWYTNGSEDYTAALTIMLSALQLIALPLNGLGNGCQPFIAYNYGLGDKKRLLQGLKYITISAFIIGTSLYIISMSFPELYSFIFGASKQVAILVKKYLPYFCMGTVMFFIQMTLQNINVGFNRSLSALSLAVMRKVIILIPLTFLFGYYYGAFGVYLSEGVADLIAGTITGIVIFTTFPRIINKRVEYLKNKENEKNND